MIPLLTQPSDKAPHQFLYWREGGVRWSILDANRTKHVLDNAGGKPELFHLPADVSESNDRAAEEPELAEQLRDKWMNWDKSNVASRLDSYKKYHLHRDQFFLDSIPAKATQEGYSPTPVPTFK